MNRRIFNDISGQTVRRWQAPDMNPPPPPPSPPEPEPEAETKPLPLTIEQIEQIQQEAHDEGFKLGHEEGTKRGYEEGFNKGQKEGREAGEADIVAETKKLQIQAKKLQTEADYLHQVLVSLQPFVDGIDQQLEQELLNLSTAVARQLVRRELQTEPGEIVAVVREALSVLPSSERRLRLQLHPEDARIVREALHLSELEQPWEIIEDPTLTRGGARLETAVSRIDATVEHRLNAVIANMWGGERRADEVQSVQAVTPGDSV